MSQANTQLSAIEKQDLKTFKKVYGDRLAFGVSGLVTVAVIAPPKGLSFGHFGVSIASPDEKKNRRKVGEYIAIQRAVMAEYSGYSGNPVNLDNFGDIQDAADSIAEMLNGWR